MKMRLELAFLVLLGCTPSPATTAQVGAYGAALDLCVANASTLEESRACRCEVNKSFDRPCKDAGAADVR